MNNPDNLGLSATRRQLLAGALSGAAALVLPRGTYAAEPYRFTHGAFDITVVSDGFITLPAEVLLPDATPEQRRPILAQLGGDAAGAPVQANIPLIRRGSDLILIDNGSGTNFQASAGKVVQQPVKSKALIKGFRKTDALEQSIISCRAICRCQHDGYPFGCRNRRQPEEAGGRQPERRSPRHCRHETDARNRRAAEGTGLHAVGTTGAVVRTAQVRLAFELNVLGISSIAGIKLRRTFPPRPSRMFRPGTR